MRVVEQLATAKAWCAIEEQRVKACPHCRRKVRLSPNLATVAVTALSRRFLRQSHFSATVWTGLYWHPRAMQTTWSRRRDVTSF